MLKFGAKQRTTLVESSPLRHVDPRTRLALSLCASLAVMLPPERMVISMILYAGFLLWARLLPSAARQVWRLRWLLLALFAIDVLVIDANLAIVITLRLILLAGVMSLFINTTTPGELRLALERLHIPYRYAFSLSLAFQSLGLLEEEWQAIREAQQARGVWQPGLFNLRSVIVQVRDLVSLTVPAIVLTTRRAWAMTEAACARGLDAPHRRSYRQLAMGWPDWVLLSVTAAICLALFFWP